MSEANLEQRIADLEHEVKRLQAINEIQNVLGKYESIHNGRDSHRSWELFARHTPDTWMEISNWGMPGTLCRSPYRPHPHHMTRTRMI